MRAEGVGGGIASSLEPSLSFCMCAAVAVVAVVVAVVAVVVVVVVVVVAAVAAAAAAAAFCANYYDAHRLHSFQSPCPWYCHLPLHHLHPGSQGYRVGMAHWIFPPGLPQMAQM